ncbi:MAG: stage II sporulation protein M [Methanoculleaceae archaeon]
MFEDRLSTSILIAALIFGISFAAGTCVALLNPDSGQSIASTVKEEVFSRIQNDNPLTLFINIFMNNLQVSIILFLGGAALGIISILILGLNGLVTGAVVGIMAQEKGIPFVLASIVPHGVLEIPAFLTAGGLGLLLGEAMLHEWRTGSGAASRARRLARHFTRTVVPLLAMAAFIEAFITPAIVQLVF